MKTLNSTKTKPEGHTNTWRMKRKRNPQKFEFDLPSGKIAAKPITPTITPTTTIFLMGLFKRQISY